MAEMVATAVGRGKIRMGYVHAGALNEVQKLKELVERRVRVVESIIGELSPALSVHTGPGMTGVCYHLVEE
jgi:fatty acid-binding protein DegV